MTADPQRGLRVVADLVDEWTAVHAELAVLERRSHPDIVDQHGRTWVWRERGDLYTHDQALAYPLHMIAGVGLMPASLADNHNYWQLCAICTSQWTDDDRARLKTNREEFLRLYGPDSRDAAAARPIKGDPT